MVLETVKAIVVGVLSITGEYNIVHTHTSGMVVAAFIKIFLIGLIIPSGTSTL